MTQGGWRERRRHHADGGAAVPKPLVPDIIYPQWNMDVRGWDTSSTTTTTTLSQSQPNFVTCRTVHYICDVGSTLFGRLFCSNRKKEKKKGRKERPRGAKRHPQPASKNRHSFYFRLMFKLLRCWASDRRPDVLVWFEPRGQESHFIGEVQKVAFYRIYEVIA